MGQKLLKLYLFVRHIFTKFKSYNFLFFTCQTIFGKQQFYIHEKISRLTIIYHHKIFENFDCYQLWHKSYR